MRLFFNRIVDVWLTTIRFFRGIFIKFYQNNVHGKQIRGYFEKCVRKWKLFQFFRIIFFNFSFSYYQEEVVWGSQIRELGRLGMNRNLKFIKKWSKRQRNALLSNVMKNYSLLAIFLQFDFQAVQIVTKRLFFDNPLKKKSL